MEKTRKTMYFILFFKPKMEITRQAHKGDNYTSHKGDNQTSPQRRQPDKPTDIKEDMQRRDNSLPVFYKVDLKAMHEMIGLPQSFTLYT